MIVSCEVCGGRFSDRAGSCPHCAKGAPAGQPAARPIAPLTGARSFHPALWVLGGALLLGGGMFFGGLYAVVRYQGDSRLGGIVGVGLGLILLLVVQVRITVTREAIRIQHLVFARTYPIAAIADVVHLTTVSTTAGVESDRVRSVVLHMKDRREVTLRPADSEIEGLITAIQQARGLA